MVALRLAWMVPLLLFFPVAGMVGAAPSGYYEVQGVQYYMTTGEIQSSDAAVTVAGAATPLPFTGCSWAKLRPDNGHGRIQLQGAMPGALVEVDMGEFVDHGVVWNATLPETKGGNATRHPTLPATVAARGTAQFYVNGAPYPDPATGSDSFSATFFVTPKGYRDDTPGDQDPAQGGEDWEMHLILESAGPAASGADRIVITRPQPPEDTPIGPSPLGQLPSYFLPSEAYSETFVFPNTRFGGNGSLEILTEGIGLQQDNNLTFTLRAPDGTILDRLYSEPSVDAGGDWLQTRTPLDQFGFYTLEVEGRISLSRYEVTYIQQPPASFDMDLWWNDVSFGADARVARDVCLDQLESPGGSLTGSVVARAEPPAYRWVPVVATVLGSVVVVLAAVKLVAHTVAAVGHQRLARR